ncbi:hypothetical protein IFO70_30610 [Phormidium tenue FACHB-886]|nr:hypothetical protein [Phormidium tenue FACHB-886]
MTGNWIAQPSPWRFAAVSEEKHRVYSHYCRTLQDFPCRLMESEAVREGKVEGKDFM